MDELVTTLGCKYNPASAGYQGGSDGTGVFTLGDRDYRWKFESKLELGEYKKRIGTATLNNIKLSDFSDKLLEILASDKSTWPQVFCLFSPHKRKDSQIQDKCLTLENNGVVPFKICLWDFDRLSSRIGHLIAGKSLSSLFPSNQPRGLNTRDYTIRTFLDEILRESILGKYIANGYVAVKYQEAVFKKIKITVTKKKTDTRYELRYVSGSNVHFLSQNDLDGCRLTKIPKKWVSLSQKSTVNLPSMSPKTGTTAYQPAAREIEAIDNDEYNKQIGTAITKLLGLFKEIEFNGTSLHQIIKKYRNRHPRVVFKIDENAQDFHDIPTRFISENDLNIPTTFSVRLENA